VEAVLYSVAGDLGQFEDELGVRTLTTAAP
jgi:hypothetical protein